MECTIELEKCDQLSIVYASGEIDAVTCSKLEETLDDLIARGEKWIVLDLKEVRYISSAGLRVLLVTTKKLHGNGRFALSRMQEEVKGILEMTGFTNIIDTHDDLEAAKSALTRAEGDQ